MKLTEKTIHNIQSRSDNLPDVDSHAIHRDDYHRTPDDPKNKNYIQPNKDQAASHRKDAAPKR
ncbi:hypothetical protein [Comamonas sp. GB3 AK4-5]|uniref:hypothetical protein n=1 Tax=Comamonas sp. GB3 AK4-5 TaxID=3231487 RepID=UPI00351DAB1A